MFDPSEEVFNGFSAWEYAKLRNLINSPSAAVFGSDNLLRMIQLSAKLDQGLAHFVEAGAYQRVDPDTGLPIQPSQSPVPPTPPVERHAIKPSGKAVSRHVRSSKDPG